MSDTGVRRSSPGTARGRVALIAISAVIAATVAAGGAAGRAEAANSPLRAASQLIHYRGRPSPARLRRIVADAAKLPKPRKGPPTNTEPKETEPVQGGVRTSGIVALVQRKWPKAVGGAFPTSVTRPDFAEGVSVAGMSIDGQNPPDTRVAASSKYIVEVVNTGALVLSPAGTVLGSFDLGSLFAGVTGQGTDPQVVYDAASGDFFATYLTGHLPSGPTTVSLGVTNNPLGRWKIYTVNPENLLQDQPKLGVSSDKITISWNDHGAGPEQFKVLQKAAAVMLKPSIPGVIWGPYSTRLNVIPAIQLSQSTTAYAIYHNHNSSSVGVLSFTGVPGVSLVSFTEKDLPVAHTTAPPSATQPAIQSGEASPKLDTGDDRLESAVWRDGELWAGGNDTCRYHTDSAARSCLRIIHISTSSMTVLRDLDITMVGGDVMYPAVMTDSRGDFWVAFSSSSAKQFASSEVSEAPGGKIGATIGAIIYRSGSGVFSDLGCTKSGANRFGDYSGAAVDPSPSVVRIWAATEFAALSPGTPCSWGTQIAAFTP